MKFNKEKKCPFCDHVYPFDFSFCPNCGKKYKPPRRNTKKDE